MTCSRLLLAVPLLVLAPSVRAHAQGILGGQEADVSDSLRNIHTLHVSPHLLVFDPDTKSATLELRNAGSTPLVGDVFVEYAYTAWPDTDLADPDNPHWSNPRDTVILAPRPSDRSAAAWIPGLPLHVQLKPHETRRLPIRIVPPAGLAAGEYAARIVTRVGVSPGAKHAQDTRQQYMLPMKTGMPFVLRDSVRVFYRQGPLRLGLAVQGANTGIGHWPPYSSPVLRDDWVRLPVHLTGNVHFEGELRHFIRANQGGTEENLYTEEITITHDGVVRHWCDVPARSPLASGHYTMVWTFVATQKAFPPSQRVPMDPVRVEIPLDIP